MPSPADREVQARADVDRIACHFHSEFVALAPHYIGTRSLGWSETTEDQRELTRAMVRRLLLEDTIRVGQRPVAVDQMPGQTSIDDEDPSAD